MTLTSDQLDGYYFGPLSQHSFFSTGIVVMIEGLAWELVEIVGGQYVFEPSDDIKAATENLEFFAKSLHG